MCGVVCMCVSEVGNVWYVWYVCNNMDFTRKRFVLDGKMSLFLLFFFWPKVVCRKDVKEGDVLFEIQYKDSLALYTSYVRSPE